MDFGLIVWNLEFGIHYREKKLMKRTFIVIACIALVMSAVPALAQGPRSMGGKSGTWEEQGEGSRVFVHKKKNGKEIDHWKAWNGPGGKLFTQPGKAENRTNSRSVVGDFPPHKGTQLRPGSNRR